MMTRRSFSARALALTSLVWPADQDAAAKAATQPFLARGAAARTSGLLAPSADVFAVSAALAAVGVGPVTATQPSYVFEASSESIRRLGDTLALRGRAVGTQ